MNHPSILVRFEVGPLDQLYARIAEGPLLRIGWEVSEDSVELQSPFATALATAVLSLRGNLPLIILLFPTFTVDDGLKWAITRALKRLAPDRELVVVLALGGAPPPVEAHAAMRAPRSSGPPRGLGPPRPMRGPTVVTSRAMESPGMNPPPRPPITPSSYP